jgi:hypothetical protein
MAVIVLGRAGRGGDAVDPGTCVEVGMREIDPGVDHGDSGGPRLMNACRPGTADAGHAGRNAVAGGGRDAGGIEEPVRGHHRHLWVSAQCARLSGGQTRREAVDRVAEPMLAPEAVRTLARSGLGLHREG